MSLNTFKKCSGPGKALTIEPQPFNTLAVNAGLDPQGIGAIAIEAIGPSDKSQSLNPLCAS